MTEPPREHDPSADEHGDDRDDRHISLLQRLHAATEDRDAEAAELAHEADVDVHDAKVAVQRARGEAGADQPATPGDMPTPDDARAVSAEHEPGERERRDRGERDDRAG
jgi:hypothetical protein